MGAIGSEHIPGCTCRICRINHRRIPWRPSEPSCVLSIRNDLQQQEVRLYSLRLPIEVINTNHLHLRLRLVSLVLSLNLNNP